jgi:hypothetical protein
LGEAGFEGHFSNKKGHLNLPFKFASSNCPLGKKCNVNDIFHAKKGTLLPEKGHFGKLGGLAPRFQHPYAEQLQNEVIYNTMHNN